MLTDPCPTYISITRNIYSLPGQNPTATRRLILHPYAGHTMVRPRTQYTRTGQRVLIGKDLERVEAAVYGIAAP